MPFTIRYERHRASEIHNLNGITDEMSGNAAIRQADTNLTDPFQKVKSVAQFQHLVKAHALLL